jgi:inosine-uridine nucleoside N-ribohydrolase
MAQLKDIESVGSSNTGSLIAGQVPLHLWVDADPSGLVWTGLDCDDDLAVLAAISAAVSGEHEHADLFLVGISVCGGNAPLRHTTANMDLLLKHLGPIKEINGKTMNKELKYHTGYGWRSMQTTSGWKSLFHYLNYIWPEKPDSTAASDAIIEAAQKLPPKELVVLMLGPATNLARALQREEGLALRLKHVYVMGGELTGQRLDLNTMSDRASTRWIIEEANVPVTVIPIQTCGQVAVTLETIDKFEQQCCPQAAACSISPKMKLQTSVMPWFVNPAVFNRLEPWRVR